MAINPFICGNPITDPVKFYDRKNEIRQITNRLLSPAHESTSVIGERRIGKTSLLLHLSNPEVAARYGLTQDKYCPIYIDCQGLLDIPSQRFWLRIFSKMQEDICDSALATKIEAFSKQKIFDLFDLEDLFNGIKDSGRNIILFMDEFENITQNENFGANFFGGLRSLAIHSGLALVTSTQRALVDLCHSYEVKSSPFFNIFTTVTLHPFSKDDSYDLLDGYLHSTEQVFTPEEKEFVVTLGGGHPFFLQMAGSYLFDEKMQGSSGNALLEHAQKTFDEQTDAHFSYLWENSSESEQKTLLIILAYNKHRASQKKSANLENLGKIYPQAHLDVNELIRRGLVLEDEGVYRLFSASLEKWIRREIVALPGDEESRAGIEEWLKASGYENVKEAKSVLRKFKKKYWPLIGMMLKEVSFDIFSKTIAELLLRLF